MQGETKAEWKTGRGSGGFSLIELMAVVLIMGILGTVVGVVVGPKIFTARAGTTKTSLQTIQTELDSYYMAKTEYPLVLTVLQLKKDKDGWGVIFFYKPTPEGARPYMLSSAGPDKDHGTEDDINVWDLDSPTN